MRNVEVERYQRLKCRSQQKKESVNSPFNITYRCHGKQLREAMKVGLRERRASVCGCCLGNIEKIDIRVGSYSQSVRVLRVPLDGMQGLIIIVWNDTDEEVSPAPERLKTLKIAIKRRTYGTSSVITSGSSHTTNPPSAVTPASLLPCTAMSVTETEAGKTGGSCKRVRSPLDRLMTRTRPRVMAYATQCVAPIVVPGTKFGSTLTRAIAVDLTQSREAWILSRL